VAAATKYALDVDGIAIHVTLKRMKSIRLHVKPSGEITLSAPCGTSQKRLREFVAARMDWIRRQQEKYANSPAAIADQATKAEVEQWRAVVKACVPPLVAEWEQILGVKVTTLAYRNMKSRWGSCQPATGRVCINVRLALYPPECLEYVVVHELCHLLEPNHGPGFKTLLTKVMPDWKQRDRTLNPH
jgi:predicted metal-dependent hydrolase